MCVVRVRRVVRVSHSRDPVNQAFVMRPQLFEHVRDARADLETEVKVLLLLGILDVGLVDDARPAGGARLRRRRRLRRSVVGRTAAGTQDGERPVDGRCSSILARRCSRR